MAQQDYSKLTVVQIRELFKTRGIPPTGLTRKQQLIDKLLEVDANSENDAHEEHQQQQQQQQRDAPAGTGDDPTVNIPAKVPDASADAVTEVREEQEAAQQVNAAQAVANQPTEDKTEEDVVNKEETPAVPVQEAVQEVQDEPLAVEKEELAEAGVEDSRPAGAQADSDTPMTNGANGTPVKPLESDAAALVSEPSEPTEQPAHVAQLGQPGQEEKGEQLHADISEQPSEDSRKRKRRSATPPVDPDEIAKKRARQEDKESTARVVLPEDEDMKDAHAAETVQDTIKAAAEDAASSDSNRLVNAADAEPAPADDEGSPIDFPPALHPETTALYISNLKRPLRAPALESHLLALAGLPTDSSLPTFHTDRMKSHAFAVFPSAAAAARARARLHRTVWPDEPQRERLWIDFIPPTAVLSYTASEDAAPNTRYEVAYEGPTGTASARHQPVSAHSQQHQDSQSRSAPSAPPLPPPEIRREDNASFLTLNELFRGTTAKPMIYWLPVKRAIAQRRLDELSARLVRRVPGGSGLPDSRRYTFEDEDLIVDGGPEFGMRGERRRGAGPFRGERARGSRYRF